MKTYLVGGAVRDKLLGRPVKDRDYVVVGETPESMLAAGFKSVGKDFPVFLHPETGEEYAIARTERKNGHGYHGFEFSTDNSVTLEQDLARRDLTINAMAEDSDGNIIDPFNGRADLEAGILRHTSEAFAEDPVRVLRVARFAARYGFNIADETVHLMRAMVKNGEVSHLVAERVWAEMRKAFSEGNSSIFMFYLAHSHAFEVLFPEITGTVTMLYTLAAAARLAPGDDVIAFALFTMNELRNFSPSALCERLKVPAEHSKMAELLYKFHDTIQNVDNLSGEQIVKLFEGTDAFRHPARFEQLLTACKIIRSLSGDEDFIKFNHLSCALEHSLQINAQEYVDAGLTGKAIGDAIRADRVQLINNLRAIVQ